MKRIETLQEIEDLELKVYRSVELALGAVTQTLSACEPIEAFTRLRFAQVGFHPTEGRPLNLIEQLNQTFTFLASLRAVRWLAEKHKNALPLRLSLGALAGFDIESENGDLVAETFAAVDPRNNDKLTKDIQKLASQSHQHRYVFYICPGREWRPPESVEGVTVVQIPWPKEKTQ